MIAMKKVEIVVEAIYINRLLELFKKHDITRYTLIRDVEGCGSHGHMMNDSVGDVNSNDYLFTAIEEDKFLEIKEDIRTFTIKYGGKCFVSDTMVIFKP
jgi:nitrogen regulatory protein PII